MKESLNQQNFFMSCSSNVSKLWKMYSLLNTLTQWQFNLAKSTWVTCKTFVYLRVLHSRLFPQFGVRRNKFSHQRIWDKFIERASFGDLSKVKDSEHLLFLIPLSLISLWHSFVLFFCSFTEPTPEGIKRRPEPWGSFCYASQFGGKKAALY